MGATEVMCCAYGENPREAFEKLVNKALHDYGYDSYNGTVSTCSLIGQAQMTFDKVSPANEKKAYKFANKQLADIGKRDCYFIDLGVDHYEVVTVKKEVNKKGEPPVFKKRFVVRMEGDGCPCTKAFEKKAEAEKFATQQILIKKYIFVEIVVDYVKVKGSNLVESFTTNITTKKTMNKALKAQPNRTVREIHKYLFYGWAAE